MGAKTKAAYNFAQKFEQLRQNPTPQKLSGFIRACRTNPDDGRQIISSWYYSVGETEEQIFRQGFPALHRFMKGAELLLFMNREFFEGVLHGRFGQWGAPQFKLWRAKFARYRHIGFEVEFFHKNQMTNYELRDAVGPSRFTWWEKYSAGGQAEVQFLTNLNQHPRRWRAQMLSEMAILCDAGVSFEGSIHANLQMTRNFGEVTAGFTPHLRCKWLSRKNDVDYYRWENKYLAGVILQEDLILQNILYIYYVQNRYDKGEILLQKMLKAYETALSTYSKDQLVFHRNLTEVIELWVKPYFIA